MNEIKGGGAAQIDLQSQHADGNDKFKDTFLAMKDDVTYLCDNYEAVEKPKCLLSLISPSVVATQLSKDFEDVKDPLEASKSYITQLFWQMERFGSEEEKSKFRNWIKTIVVEDGLSSSFISQKTQRSEFSEVIEYIRSDIINMLGNYEKLKELSITGTVDSYSDNPERNDRLDGFMYKSEKDFLEKHNLCSLIRCSKCGSTNTKVVVALTHSSSTESLIQLFTFKLPNLEGKKLLDLGSGLGSILFGAYSLSAAAEITGIEFNPILCRLVNKVIVKYDFSDRVKVIAGNVLDYEEVLKSQDVIICNNAFEYFQSDKAQVEVLEFLKSTLKPGCWLVTNPKLDVLMFPFLKYLSFEKNIWVSEIPPFNTNKTTVWGPDSVDEDFHVYIVK